MKYLNQKTKNGATIMFPEGLKDTPYRNVKDNFYINVVIYENYKMQFISFGTHHHNPLVHL